MANQINFSVGVLWTGVAEAALLSFIAIIFYAQYIVLQKNNTLAQRKKNVKRLTMNIMVTGAFLMIEYIVLVSSSGQYRDRSLWFGMMLVAAGLVGTFIVCYLGYLISAHMWNKMYLERRRKNDAIRRARSQRDYFIKCLEMHKSIMDLNPYAEDLPPAND